MRRPECQRNSFDCVKLLELRSGRNRGPFHPNRIILPCLRGHQLTLEPVATLAILFTTGRFRVRGGFFLPDFGWLTSASSPSTVAHTDSAHLAQRGYPPFGLSRENAKFAGLQALQQHGVLIQTDFFGDREYTKPGIQALPQIRKASGL